MKSGFGIEIMTMMSHWWQVGKCRLIIGLARADAMLSDLCLASHHILFRALQGSPSIGQSNSRPGLNSLCSFPTASTEFETTESEGMKPIGAIRYHIRSKSSRLPSLPISSPIPCPLNENLGRHTSMSFFRGAGDRNTLGVSVNSKVSGVITLIFGSILILYLMSSR
jgi:hypothetical protein